MMTSHRTSDPMGRQTAASVHIYSKLRPICFLLYYIGLCQSRVNEHYDHAVPNGRCAYACYCREDKSWLCTGVQTGLSVRKHCLQ